MAVEQEKERETVCKQPLGLSLLDPPVPIPTDPPEKACRLFPEGAPKG